MGRYWNQQIPRPKSQTPAVVAAQDARRLLLHGGSHELHEGRGAAGWPRTASAVYSTCIKMENGGTRSPRQLTVGTGLVERGWRLEQGSHRFKITYGVDTTGNWQHPQRLSGTPYWQRSDLCEVPRVNEVKHVE